jgi:peptidoglycan/LPS O-acetylase OafA/YrhL
LDALRFVAAFFVIIGHCQAVLYNVHAIEVYAPFASKLGSFGVDFFFALSGFLISYLLLKELDDTDTIHIPHFYARRFLRIWPLYFLVGIFSILFGTAMSFYFGAWLGYPPAEQGTGQLLENLFYLCTFTINFQTLWHLGNPFQVAHFWSLAVEEQFYLLWAPVLKRFKKALLPTILLFCGLGFLLSLPPDTWFEGYQNFQYNFTANRFFQFGIGGLLAWLLRHDYLTPQYKQSKYSQYAVQLAYLIPMSLFLFGAYYYPKAYKDGYEQIVNGVISVGIIACAIAPHSVFKLENPVLKYLGRISFGIYVFHILAVRLAEKILLDYCHMPISTTYFVCYLGLSTFLAIALAALSYAFYEKPFLRLKSKFK